jgi:hypothetical protein
MERWNRMPAGIVLPEETVNREEENELGKFLQQQ